MNLLFGCVEIRHYFELCADEYDSENCCDEVCDRCGVHCTVNAHKHWQNHQQRQQEDNLTGQRKEDAAFRHTNRGEEVGGNRLQEVHAGEEHVNTEVLFRKSEVFFRTAAEQTDNLTREQLEAGKDVILEIEIQGALQVKEKFPESLLFQQPF